MKLLAEEEAARRAHLQQQHEVQSSGQYGIGCILLIFGVFGLCLAVPALVLTGMGNFRSAISSIDWTSFDAFRQSAWAWLQHGVQGPGFALFWLFNLAYYVLFSQWLSEQFGWRRFLSGQRLWTVSFVYFQLMIVALIYAMWEVGEPGFIMVLLIPILFLAIIANLWRPPPRTYES